MFKRLIARDFKRHEYLDMEFHPGLTLLVGANYTGKSSVLHAILYAFGGPTAVPGGSEVVTRKGATQAEVTLTFEVAGSTYELMRAGSKVRLSRDGKPAARSASAVSTYLEDLIGLSKDRFMQLKHGAQKETEALLTLGVAKLHGLIEELSGAQTVTEVIGRASKAFSEAKGGLEALPESDLEACQQTATDLADELKRKAVSLRELEQQAQVQHGDLERSIQAVTRARQANVEVLNLEQKVSELARGKERWQAALQEEEQLLANLVVPEHTLEEAQQRRDQALQAAARVEAESRQLVAARNAERTLTDRVARTYALVVKSEEGLLGSLDFVEEAPSTEILNKANAVFQEKKHARGKVLTALKDGICPTCMRPFEGFDREALEQERQQLEKDLIGASASLQQAKEDADKIKTNNQLRQDMERRLESDRQTLAQQQQDLQAATDLLSSLTDVDENTDDLKEQAKRWGVLCDAHQKAQAQRESAERGMDAAKKALAGIADEAGKLGPIPSKIDTAPLEAVEKRAQERYSKTHSEVQYQQGLYQGRYAEWQAARDAAKKAKALEAKRVMLTRRSAGIEDLLKYLRKNRDRFLSEIWDGIMSYASNFASSCTEGAIERILRNDNGTFSYYEDEVLHPIKAASGAQRSIMGLGVQLALAQMLPSPLSVLLLDEPTADLDPARSLAMASLLAQESGQVLMVSHRELDGAVAADVYDMGEAA